MTVTLRRVKLKRQIEEEVLASFPMFKSDGDENWTSWSRIDYIAGEPHPFRMSRIVARHHTRDRDFDYEASVEHHASLSGITWSIDSWHHSDHEWTEAVGEFKSRMTRLPQIGAMVLQKVYEHNCDCPYCPGDDQSG